MRRAGIVITGNEVLKGKTEERNFRWLSGRLETLGFDVKECIVVGDNKEDIKGAFKVLENKVDVIIVTGGLGPTSDDITSEAASEFFGKELKLNPEALNQVESFWKKMGRKTPKMAKKQAYLPEGASVILNPLGSAPGFYIKHKSTLYFFLPGVPREVSSMFEIGVIPVLKKEFALKEHPKEMCIVTFGIIESRLMEKLKGFENLFPSIQLGYRIKFPEVLLYLNDTSSNFKLLEEAAYWIKNRLSEKVVSLNGESLPLVVGKLLKEKNNTLAVAESCTGGLIGHLITNYSGSSDYFLLGCVTYSNDAKLKVLGVREETLNEFGAVHEKTAEEMASGVRRLIGADFGLATTGIAGPTGGSIQKPVGTVCIGLATRSFIKSFKFTFNFTERLLNKKIFAYTALDVLRRTLLGLD